MAASVLSVPMFRALSEAGVPLASGKVFTYAAGTSSLLPSYTDSTAVSKNTNPVILDANGEAAIWLASVPYKIEVRDSADVVQWTMDNVQPESVLAGAEWSLMSDVPTYVDTNTFTVPGNRITTFIQGRRVRATITGSTVDGTINSSAYSTLTTIGVTWDNTGINNTISAISLGILATVGADSALQAATSASNAATSELNAAGSASAAATSEANATAAASSVSKGSANGIASLDANTEVVELPAGAAAEVAAGRGGSVKRADGSWSQRVINIPIDTNLQTWADSLPASGLYDVGLTAAQGNLPVGWWYIEYMRHTYDTSSNPYHTMRATRLNVVGQRVYLNTNVLGTWSGWEQQGVNTSLTWNTPTFVSGWVDYGSVYIARYAQDSMGNVFLKGLVRGGSNSVSSTIFTLPVGMRPSSNIIFACDLSGGVGRLEIGSKGNVDFVGNEAHTGNANTWLSIQATFKGEQ